MKCPNCTGSMTSLTVEKLVGARYDIDLCANCQSFWFDQYEDLQLSPASALNVMKFIGEHASPPPLLSTTIRCPKCASLLFSTHDMAHDTKFSYLRCGNEHG